MKIILLKLFKDSLFKNSIYPILTTGIMSGLGFVFWLIIARYFPVDQVGIAVTLISIMSMISVLGLAGFDTAIIRFLSNSDNKNANLNTSIIIVSTFSFTLATLFLFLVKHISPELLFIRENTLIGIAFITFCVFATINLLTDAIFLAFRKTKYTLVISAIFSFIKMFLPFFFISYGAFGIFVAASISQIIGSVLSILLLIKKFDYRPSFFINISALRNVWKYSTGNYTADILYFLPIAVLPVIITNGIGPDKSAYYYMVMMIIGLLYIIPTSVTRSLFAEGSFDKGSIQKNVKSAIKHTTLMLTPAIAMLLLGGNFLLSLFGHEYSTGGVTFLYIMTLSSVLVSAFALYGSLFRLTHNISALIFRNITYSVSTIGLTYALLPYGLTGIGIAYATGTTLATLVSYVLYTKQTLYIPKINNNNITP